MVGRSSVAPKVFDAAYGSPVRRFWGLPRTGGAPWETGAPQPDIVGLADACLISGRVLDAGCGTGENALFLAERGLDVLGVDASPAAVETARTKARDRQVAAKFCVCDALDLPAVPERFDTLIDSGLFHVLSAGDRRRMIGAAHMLLRPGGTYHLLCFSGRKRRPAPHRLSEQAILRNFGPGWRVESLVESRYHVLDGTIGPNAWLGRFTRA